MGWLKSRSSCAARFGRPASTGTEPRKLLGSEDAEERGANALGNSASAPRQSIALFVLKTWASSARKRRAMKRATRFRMSCNLYLVQGELS
ncbi:hypothetical protein ACVWXN_008029 [Bradyrhizobium sp. i1.4.4]